MNDEQNHNKTTTHEGRKTTNVRSNEEPKELKLGSFLTSQEDEQFTHLLKEFMDVFTWVKLSYKDVSKID